MEAANWAVSTNPNNFSPDQKTPPKKQIRSKKRTTNTQACKQTQAKPPGRLKWVGGTPEGITISITRKLHFQHKS